MVRTIASLAIAGALSFSVAPAFAQDIDLDPFHIFTPAPEAAPAPAPMMHHHHHHMMMHHKMMMMHHKKMMMHHKMMKKM